LEKPPILRDYFNVMRDEIEKKLRERVGIG
jgi:hypothetical protein